MPMRLNLALFRVDVTDEIVVNSELGRPLDLQERPGHAARRLRARLEWPAPPTVSKRRSPIPTSMPRSREPFTTGISTPSVPTAVSAGNRLPGVPPQMLCTASSSGVTRRPGFHAGVEVRHNGKVYVNDPNTEAASAYTVWNLRAGFEQRGRNWRISEFVRVDNVADRALHRVGHRVRGQQPLLRAGAQAQLPGGGAGQPAVLIA